MTRRGLLLAAAAPAGDLTNLTLAQASALIARREVSPVDLTRACLDRIAKRNAEINAFITVMDEQALADARRLEREKPRGPLHGIPIALKDLIDTAGVRTTMGSALHAQRVPTRDADVTARLREAGAVLIGKANMDEFAYNFTGETSHFGPCVNPWRAKTTPGGSSGGSAAGVADRQCYAAVGSDTGGSIRLPAAFCGIHGLKPGYGLVNTEGTFPLAWSMDHLGPMARTAEDTALLLAGMTGQRYPLGLGPRGLRGIRIGMPRGSFTAGLTPEAAAAMEAAANAFRKLGAAVSDGKPPEIPMLPIIRAEAFALHQETLRDRDRLHPRTRHEILEGEKITTVAYANAIREMLRLRAAMPAVFREADFLLTPTAPGPAFPLDPGRTPDLAYLGNTLPFNVVGLPTLSVPCGFTSAGLPLGMQITGPMGSEARVLALAHAYDRATGWTARRPA